MLQIGIKNTQKGNENLHNKKKIYRDVACLLGEIPVIVEYDKILKTFIETRLKFLRLSMFIIYIMYVI